MSILEDYWKIAKKATDTLEVKFEKLKAAKISEVKKEILYNFIDMHKDCLTTRVVTVEIYGHTNRTMHYIVDGLFYNSAGRHFYLINKDQEFNNPVFVHIFELPNYNDETINKILEAIDKQFNGSIEEIGG